MDYFEIKNKITYEGEENEIIKKYGVREQGRFKICVVYFNEK